jgi:hypothetical protein
MRRRPQSSAASVQETVSPETAKSEGLAEPKKAATWLAAVAVLSTVPASPAAGEQVIRPRHGKAGWPVSAALSEYGFGRLLPGGTSIRMKG